MAQSVAPKIPESAAETPVLEVVPPIPEELPPLPEFSPGTELAKIDLQQALPPHILNGAVKVIILNSEGGGEYRAPGSANGGAFYARRIVVSANGIVSVLSAMWPECLAHMTAGGALVKPSGMLWKHIPAARIALMTPLVRRKAAKKEVPS